jgi:hypothetical protein
MQETQDNEDGKMWFPIDFTNWTCGNRTINMDKFIFLKKELVDEEHKALCIEKDKKISEQ